MRAQSLPKTAPVSPKTSVLCQPSPSVCPPLRRRRRESGRNEMTKVRRDKKRRPHLSPRGTQGSQHPTPPQRKEPDEEGRPGGRRGAAPSSSWRGRGGEEAVSRRRTKDCLSRRVRTKRPNSTVCTGGRQSRPGPPPLGGNMLPFGQRASNPGCKRTHKTHLSPKASSGRGHHWAGGGAPTRRRRDSVKSALVRRAINTQACDVPPSKGAEASYASSSGACVLRRAARAMRNAHATCHTQAGCAKGAPPPAAGATCMLANRVSRSARWWSPIVRDISR